MVPEVDKKDTHQQLSAQREQFEAIRQEIISWVLPKKQTSDDSEAQAVRKLAVRSAQQARQWTGKMIGELGAATPYPNSSDASNQLIDKSTVPTDARLLVGSGEEITVVQRIKHVRALTSRIKGELDEMLTQCVPGSFFNQCLFQVQNHAVQTGMWLGELLNEFFEAQPKIEPSVLVVTAYADLKDKLVGEVGTPERDEFEGELATELKAEAEASKNDSASSSEEAPTTSTQPTSSETTTGSEPSNETTSPESEAVASGESIGSPVTTSEDTAKEDTTGAASAPSSQSKSTEAAEPKTKKSGKSVDK